MKSKRLLALLLTFVLTFSFAMPAFAQDHNVAAEEQIVVAAAQNEDEEIDFEMPTGWRGTLFTVALLPFMAVTVLFSWLPSSIANPLQFILMLPLAIVLQPLFLIALRGLVFLPLPGWRVS